MQIAGRGEWLRSASLTWFGGGRGSGLVVQWHGWASQRDDFLVSLAISCYLIRLSFALVWNIRNMCKMKPASVYYGCIYTIFVNRAPKYVAP